MASSSNGTNIPLQQQRQNSQRQQKRDSAKQNRRHQNQRRDSNASEVVKEDQKEVKPKIRQFVVCHTNAFGNHTCGLCDDIDPIGALIIIENFLNHNGYFAIKDGPRRMWPSIWVSQLLHEDEMLGVRARTLCDKFRLGYQILDEFPPLREIEPLTPPNLTLFKHEPVALEVASSAKDQSDKLLREKLPDTEIYEGYGIVTGLSTDLNKAKHNPIILPNQLKELVVTPMNITQLMLACNDPKIANHLETIYHEFKPYVDWLSCEVSSLKSFLVSIVPYFIRVKLLEYLDIKYIISYDSLEVINATDHEPVSFDRAIKHVHFRPVHRPWLTRIAFQFLTKRFFRNVLIYLVELLKAKLRKSGWKYFFILTGLQYLIHWSSVSGDRDIPSVERVLVPQVDVLVPQDRQPIALFTSLPIANQTIVHPSNLTVGDVNAYCVNVDGKYVSISYASPQILYDSMTPLDFKREPNLFASRWAAIHSRNSTVAFPPSWHGHVLSSSSFLGIFNEPEKIDYPEDTVSNAIDAIVSLFLCYTYHARFASELKEIFVHEVIKPIHAYGWESFGPNMSQPSSVLHRVCRQLVPLNYDWINTQVNVEIPAFVRFGPARASGFFHPQGCLCNHCNVGPSQYLERRNIEALIDSCVSKLTEWFLHVAVLQSTFVVTVFTCSFIHSIHAQLNPQ